MADARTALNEAVARLEEVRRALGAEETPAASLADLADEAVRLAGEVSGLVAESLRGGGSEGP
jgi:hypothetical protein